MYNFHPITQEEYFLIHRHTALIFNFRIVYRSNIHSSRFPLPFVPAILKEGEEREREREKSSLGLKENTAKIYKITESRVPLSRKVSRLVTGKLRERNYSSARNKGEGRGGRKRARTNNYCASPLPCPPSRTDIKKALEDVESDKHGGGTARFHIGRIFNSSRTFSRCWRMEKGGDFEDFFEEFWFFVINEWNDYIFLFFFMNGMCI